tara:strand:- start:5 stop:307 length:303 start_codon:yes stop_codon:yes gene_type:complete
MAWKKVQVRTIPNANTPFETMSDEVINYIKTNYDDTGKRTSFSVSSSGNGLVLTYTSVYSSEATKNEFANDSTISTEAARRNKINEDRGITKEVTVDEEV